MGKLARHPLQPAKRERGLDAMRLASGNSNHSGNCSGNGSGSGSGCGSGSGSGSCSGSGSGSSSGSSESDSAGSGSESDNSSSESSTHGRMHARKRPRGLGTRSSRTAVEVVGREGATIEEALRVLESMAPPLRRPGRPSNAALAERGRVVRLRERLQREMRALSTGSQSGVRRGVVVRRAVSAAVRAESADEYSADDESEVEPPPAKVGKVPLRAIVPAVDACAPASELKRPRGRPPKNAASRTPTRPKASVVSDESSGDDNSTWAVGKKGPRALGRNGPRVFASDSRAGVKRQLPVSNTKPAPRDQAQGPPVVKKRRGRPPKPKPSPEPAAQVDRATDASIGSSSRGGRIAGKQLSAGKSKRLARKGKSVVLPHARHGKSDATSGDDGEGASKRRPSTGAIRRPGLRGPTVTFASDQKSRKGAVAGNADASRDVQCEEGTEKSGSTPASASAAAAVSAAQSRLIAALRTDLSAAREKLEAESTRAAELEEALGLDINVDAPSPAEIERLESRLQARDRELAERDRELTERDELIREKDQEISELVSRVGTLESKMQLADAARKDTVISGAATAQDAEEDLTANLCRIAELEAVVEDRNADLGKLRALVDRHSVALRNTVRVSRDFQQKYFELKVQRTQFAVKECSPLTLPDD